MKNVHLIPTEKPSKLRYNLSNVLVFTKESYRDYGKKANQHIYITSEEEDFNENDYVITKDGRLVQVSYLLSKDLDGASKVVIASDPDLIAGGVQSIDDEFLEWFVKNPSCEEVEVERVVVYDDNNYGNGEIFHSNKKFEYKIIILKEQQKQHLIDMMKEDEELGLYDETLEEERMYSEEEVIEQLNILMSLPSSTLDKFTDDNGNITIKWFEQLKK